MAIKSSWSAGDVLSAADLTDTFGSKLSYALPVNAVTASTYTFVLADANKLVTASNANATTYIVPPSASVTWLANSVIRVANYGTGTVTASGGSGVTITNSAQTIGQYQSAALVRTGTDAWTVLPFSGGADNLATANVSASTGSPSTGTYTDAGVTYRYYSFTGSGTITFNKSGLVSVLVVGGGGGGGSGLDSGAPGGAGGGGGGGGYREISSFYVTTGSAITVTVGGGGTGAPTSGLLGTHGTASTFGDLTMPGGAGGGGTYLYGQPPSGGGSGGGASGYGGAQGIGSATIGQNGGTAGAASYGGGGGGGRASAGSNSTTSDGGNGGSGSANGYTGTNVNRAPGGGGGAFTGNTAGTGGTGGGGAGGVGTGAGSSASVNRGGGGGGGGNASGGQGAGGNGSSGIVIVRVRS